MDDHPGKGFSQYLLISQYWALHNVHDELGANEATLFFRILFESNKNFWLPVPISKTILMTTIGCSDRAFYRARKSLIEIELVKYTSAEGRGNHPSYEINFETFKKMQVCPINKQ